MRPEFGVPWGGSSSEKERALHCFHKRLLRDLIKRPPDKRISIGSNDEDADEIYLFPWGTVSAATDIKAGGNLILIEWRDR